MNTRHVVHSIFEKAALHDQQKQQLLANQPPEPNLNLNAVLAQNQI